MLRHGDTGHEVTLLQRQLSTRGEPVLVDGWFGDETEAAVRRFQRERGLVVDGIAGPKTRAALHEQGSDKSLRHADIVRASEHLDVEMAVVLAFNEVESRGSGFIGRAELPVILFERHKMYRRLDHHGLDAPGIASHHPALVNRRPGGYEGGLAEHRRLEQAQAIHRASALESCSWGLFQIMGYHWERLGYQSIETFVQAMQTSEGQQLDAFVRFVRADPRLLASLRDRDWAGAARIYNGPAYWRHDYDTRLAAAYRRHSAA